MGHNGTKRALALALTALLAVLCPLTGYAAEEEPETVTEDLAEPATEQDFDEPEQAPDQAAESPVATVSVGGTATEYADFAAAWAAAAAAGAVRTSDLVITGGAFTGTAGAGLALANDCSAVLSGGTFTGSVYAVVCLDADPVTGLPMEQKLTVNALAATGYGFFDGANALVAVGTDQKALAGPVTVAALPPATAEPTAEPTAAPTAEPTAEPTATPAPTPTATPAPTPTPEPTVTPTLTPEPTATAAPTATAGPTAVPTATAPAAPATGDETGLLSATALLLGCAAGLAAVLLLRRRWEK